MSISKYPLKVIATKVTGNVEGSVASVVGNLGGNVVGTVASVVNAIIPTKAYNAVYYNASASQNTYYTALNISGKGILNKVNFSHSNTPNSTNLYIKLTIDGTAYEFTPTNSYYANDALYSYNNYPVGIKYTGPIYFNTSLKVECKSNGSNTNNFEVITEYALV